MKRFDLAAFESWARAMRRPYHDRYLAMYSSFLGGLVTDPALMFVPLDDHMTHRGDAVFEAFKCVGGSLYNLQAHLARLEHSMAEVSLKPPVSVAVLRDLAIETVRAGGQRDCDVRLFVSRGPGSFSPNPYDCPESQVYIVALRSKGSFMSAHPAGARGGSSRVPQKGPFFSRIKSVNYLPNVLMKKEAVDHGVDFVAAFDERGMLTEGATENVGLVTRDRRLLFPHIETILAGTTMLRVMELARGLVGDGGIREAAFDDVPRDAVPRAAELLVVGTTWDVTSAVEFDGVAIGDGKPGPVGRELNRRLVDDIHRNAALRTPVF
jgi:branched-subunit amino acid aminotransferase/4-amino-4-deoxychorismate lyase